MSGTIVFLNGTSSSGKTSIAKTLQEILGPGWLHSGVDHYLERVAPDFHTVTKDPDVDASGLRWLTTQDEKDLIDVRWGPLGLRMADGMYRAAAAYVRAGNNLIFDDVLFDDRAIASMTEAFDGIRVLMVGVTCPLDEIERREVARGNRVPGSGRLQFERVHVGRTYDLEVDTAVLSAAECAKRIAEAIDA
jgi:chloramphenicol 3-O phosphotransferase